MSHIKILEKGRLVEYNGEKFAVQGGCRYFQSYKKELPERLLHRLVWMDANGEIPKGFHIHHKDGDRFNNNIGNLECVAASEHQREHAKARFLDPEYKSANKEHLDRVRGMSVEWHRSEEGRKWHVEHANKPRKIHSMKCSVCSSKYDTTQPKNSTTCSNKCASQKIRNNPKVKRLCKRCEGVFLVPYKSYRKAYCGRCK